MKTVAIVGAGGFGREVYDQIITSDRDHRNWTVAGFVDHPASADLLRTQGLHWLGTDEDFIACAAADSVIVAIGDPVIRARVVRIYENAGVEISSFVHPTALISPSVHLGPGTIVCAQAMVMNGTRIGAHCHIDRAGMVGHDCHLGDLVSVYPGAVVSGRVSIGSCARIGTGSRILPELQIGAGAFVGAGAVVTTRVPANQTFVGVPARLIQSRRGHQA